MDAWIIMKKTLMITSFVASMMIAIEYINIQTRGLILRTLGKSLIRQYLLAVILGATPGCLGAFVLVGLYVHRRLSIGALVAGMIATSGDEMFVMLTLFPQKAFLLTGGLIILGIFAGWFTDTIVRMNTGISKEETHDFDLHDEEDCRCFPRGSLLKQWRPPSAHRATLAVGIALFLLALLAGQDGSQIWDWKRITFIIVVGFGLFVICTVPDHFLDEHLWGHVFQMHVPRLFLWTGGALFAIAFLGLFLDLKTIAADNSWIILVAAALLGIIPESGPHLLFITLFAEGAVPLSVLVTSSTVQDGHGMLPLLAYSRKDFLRVKTINLIFGLVTGTVLMAIGL